MECNIKSQHKINCKIKEVNYENGKNREEENVTQDDRKTGMVAEMKPAYKEDNAEEGRRE